MLLYLILLLLFLLLQISMNVQSTKEAVLTFARTVLGVLNVAAPQDSYYRVMAERALVRTRFKIKQVNRLAYVKDVLLCL